MKKTKDNDVDYIIVWFICVIIIMGMMYLAGMPWQLVIIILISSPFATYIARDMDRRDKTS